VDDEAHGDLIRRWLDKARDDLATASDDLKLGHTRGAVNRSYYAIFHAPTAALLSRGEERARHSGVQSAFGEIFIVTGLFDAEFSRIYARARREREEADYSPAPTAPTIEEASARAGERGRFVRQVEQFLTIEGYLTA
jgi:uncharacterized protein (UPF0332 family)